MFYLVNPGGLVCPPCPPNPGGRLLPPPKPGGRVLPPNPGGETEGGRTGGGGMGRGGGGGAGFMMGRIMGRICIGGAYHSHVPGLSSVSQ